MDKEKALKRKSRENKSNESKTNTTIKEVSNSYLPDLLTSISEFAWPLVTLIIVLIFKKQFEGLIARISTVKAFGGEAEFKQDLSDFAESVDKANESVAKTSGDLEVEESTFDEGTQKDIDIDYEEILEISKFQPELGVIKLSSSIEKKLRELIATMGLLKDFKSLTLKSMLDKMVARNALAPSLVSSISMFIKIRNEIVHGKVENRNNVISAIDIGLNLLKAIQAIPHERHIVKKINVELFTDETCETRREDVKGIILENSNVHGTSSHMSIFPTTKSHFVIGKQVAWEWNMGNLWEETWYIDESGSKKLAWSGSAEFIGRHIDEL